MTTITEDIILENRLNGGVVHRRYVPVSIITSEAKVANITGLASVI
jgi:hypothetical protein